MVTILIMIEHTWLDTKFRGRFMEGQMSFHLICLLFLSLCISKLIYL